MTMVHKENEKVFIGSPKCDSPRRSKLLTTTLGLFSGLRSESWSNPDSWLTYLTDDNGVSFRPAGWQFRESVPADTDSIGR